MAPPKVDNAARVLPQPIEAAGNDKAKPETKAPEKAPEAPKTERPAESETSFGDSLASFGHLQIDGAYALSGFMDLSNPEVDPTYSGHGGDLKIKWMYDVNPHFSIGGGYSHAWRATSMSFHDINSVLNKSTWGLGFATNIDIIPEWLRLSLDLYFGKSSIDSGKNESTDGVNGDGAIYAGNSLKYNVDGADAFAFQFNACLGIPEFLRWDYAGIGAQACYGLTQSKHELHPDAIDRSPTDSAQPVSTTDQAFLLGLTLRIGKNAEQNRYRAEEVEKDRVAQQEEKSGKTEEKPKNEKAAAADLKPEVSAALKLANEISTDAEAALAKNHAKTIADLASGIRAEDKSDSFSRVKDIFAEYQSGITELKSIAPKLKNLEQAFTTEPLSKMSEADRKPAIDASAQANANVEKLFNETKANRTATIEAIQRFQEMPGLSNARKAWCQQALKILGIDQGKTKNKSETKAAPQNLPPTADNKCPDGYNATAMDGDTIVQCSKAQ